MLKATKFRALGSKETHECRFLHSCLHSTTFFLMSDGDEISSHYRRPPVSTMIWTAISLAVGLGTLLYWLIM